MILNELSVQMQNIKDKEDVQRKISSFINVCHTLFHEKGDKTFYYMDTSFLIPFLENYSLQDWFKDPTVSKKEKDFFRMLINRRTLFQASDFSGSEVKLFLDDKKVTAIGCLAAYEWNSFVVSFSSLEIWNEEWIPGEYVTLQENEQIFVEPISVRNCSNLKQISEIESEERYQMLLHISSGKELWEKCEELYPHLIFCDSVKKQMEEARVSLQIQNIMRRIQLLEDYFKSYDGKFDKNQLGHGCRYESEDVQKDEKLRNMRKFKTPFGNEEYFYWHISFPGNYPGRIHFLPDAKRRVGIIGYVGKHLPTKKYRTI